MNKEYPSYKTIARPVGPVLVKERKSKFLGWAFSVTDETEVAARVSQLKGEYADASHVCYGYRIDPLSPRIRVNDDGEPSNSAGRPILGQIESSDLYNILICVVRYYGGTKLGVGGLIQAYRETARRTLQESLILTRVPVSLFRLAFDYDRLDAVMRLVSQLDLEIRHQEFGLDCRLEVEVSSSTKMKARDGLLALGKIKVEEFTSYASG